MLDRMSLLFRFQAIAEAGSVRKAAETLNITQPALSRSLSQLEQFYRQPLFERHARGVRPTGFGTRLLSTISRLSRDWELAELELASGGRSYEGVLRISAGPLWSAVVLPVVIGQLGQSYPNLVIEIGYQQTSVALIEGRIDVSFGGLHSLERGASQLIAQPFTTVRDRIIARADHPIHRRRPDDYDAVHDYPWIVYAADPIYEAESLHAVVERTGAAPQIRIRSTSLLTVLRLLQEGDYLCMLPDAAVTGMFGPPIKPTPIDLGRRGGPSGALYRSAMSDYPPLQELLRLCALFFEGKPDTR
jgi:DNA-binding transcriptional LysR family regulator